MTSSPGGDDVGRLLRDLAPQVLGAVARRHGDFTAAEDAVQEALIAAARQWPAEGTPANPRGWLYHVAVRRLTDHVRGELARRRREEAVASGLWAEWAFVPPPDAEVGVERDDTLALLFMCCHSALTPPSAIALTLRAVGGLSTAEIANAFLVPEATMAQRISRAKQSIRASGVPFGLPGAAERGERLRAVLHVLYLMFNEGYASSVGPVLQRADLSDEAIRLARAAHQLMPDDAEVAGLLALMLLTDARRAARSGPAGELIPLDEQDRTRWDRALIAEGVALVSAALSRGSVGPYQLQAAIAALHDEAPRAADTDWSQILALYELLKRTSDNPMVALNHAIATAMVRGPAAGLELLATLDGDPRVGGHYRLDAVRGHLLERLGETAPAIEHYRSAAERTASVPERNYLLTRAARLARPGRAAADGDQERPMPAKARISARTIDEYLAALPPDQRAALEALRKTIRAVAPDAEECISYQLAAFRRDGMLVAMGATANHCALYLMSGTTLDDFRKELRGYDVSKGTIRFQPAAPLPAALVRKLVKARLAENARGR